MKKLFLLWGIWLLANSIYAQNSLSGKITDQQGATLPFATVYISDLKKGCITDTAGNYQLYDLPSGIFLVEFRLLGYENKLVKLEIKGQVTYNISLEESHIDLKEITLTGMSAATEKTINPVPSIGISKLKLQETASSNIIDAISSTPGISQVSSGAGISKPIIRGLGFNRVLVLQNNSRQEGQQWGEEHGIEIDEFSVNRVEIIKGPGSLAYGSDAMGGVINMLSADPVENGKQRLNFLSTFHSVNAMQGYSLIYEGNKNNVYWNLQGTRKQAAAYKNAYDGKVFNSGFNEWNGNGMLGLSKKWGYAQLHFSSYNQNVGIITGERDSTGKFTEEIILNDTTTAVEVVSEEALKDYELHLPRQQVNHQRVSLNGKIFRNLSVFQYNFGFQQNRRREYEAHLHGNEVHEEASIYQILNTLTYDLNYHHHFKLWETTFGLNGYTQNGMNAGEEFIIPEYRLNDIGIYAISQRVTEKWVTSGGLRYNYRNLATAPLFLNAEGVVTQASDTNALEKFTAFEKNYSSFAWSAGSSYRIKEKVVVKLNVAGGFRAPNLSELGSNGAHHGTFRYEKGNIDLKPENSLQVDFSFHADTKHLSFEAAGFYNQVSNFIYSRKLLNTAGSDSLITESGEISRVFQFVQSDARLYGGEITLDIHPHPFDWLHFENSFSVVYAEMKNGTDSTKYLPFIPAPKFQSEIRAELHEPKGVFSGSYLSFTLAHYFEQNRIFSAYNTETETPAYTLFNASVGTDFVSKKGKKIVTLIFSAQNLTDVAYQNHLSRLKYLSTNLSTQRQGVFNPGRNFMIKLVLPVGWNGH